MRWVTCAAFVLALTPSAFAGDFDILRGSQPTYHWGGVYGGVQGGYSSSSVNFGQAASSDIGYLLRSTAIEQDQGISQWTVLGNRSPTGTGLGGFIGYNCEWEDLILGLELNYNHVSLSANSSDSIARSFTDSTNLPSGHHYLYDVNVSGQSSLHITDIATFRGRAGWETGIFLPYGFAGFALGRANTSTTATLSFTATDYPDSEIPALTPLSNLSYGPVTQGNAQNNALAYGVAAGGGVDIAVLPNVFLRGEIEYIYFAPVNDIHVTVTTARLGAGLKF